MTQSQWCRRRICPVFLWMFLAFVHCVARAQPAPLILEQPASVTTTLDRDVTFQ